MVATRIGAPGAGFNSGSVIGQHLKEFSCVCKESGILALLWNMDGIQLEKDINTILLQRRLCDLVGYLCIFGDIWTICEYDGKNLHPQMYSSDTLRCSRLVAYLGSNSGVHLSSVVSFLISLIAKA
jgi:hypothetical protein